jgi:hypothetical protein
MRPLIQTMISLRAYAPAPFFLAAEVAAEVAANEEIDNE